MKTKSAILVGVGGQGAILTAKVLVNGLMKAGYDVKMSEVHGMSQRGGDVQSNLRLSSEVIYSDLIPCGSADLIISMEPMEALRYLPYLAADGRVVTSAKPFVNIPNYPSEEALMAELASLPDVVMLDIEEAARACGNPKGANMVLLGMAAPAIGILDADALRAAIGRVFARKGEAIVAANRKAFDIGLEAGL